MTTPPKVFISYCHDDKDPKHADRVFDFSERLREDGIDTILDQYEQAPPEGWPRWMDKNIDDADFVLMVCTEPYYLRVMGKEKPGKGLGVRWEGNLIYNALYKGGTINTKFIPVLFDGLSSNQIPSKCSSLLPPSDYPSEVRRKFLVVVPLRSLPF